MDRAWYVGRINERVLLVHSPARRSSGSMSPREAAFRAPAWLGGDAAGRHVLLDILDALGEPPVRPGAASLDRARRRVEEALARGEIAAFAVEERLSGGAVEKPPEAPRAQPAEEKHFVEFELTYPDGSPVSGLGYELVWPDGKREPGTLGGDGLVTREDVPPGGYVLVIPEVDVVRWDRARARAGDEVTVRASVSGFAEGAAAKILVYREHREQPGDEIAKLSAAVKGDAVEATFAFADHAGEERMREEGTIPLIAEVSLEGGKHWGKTTSALAVEMPAITAARWSTTYAEDGDQIAAAVTVAGVEDGTKARLDVYRFHDKGGADDKVKTLDAEVAGGRIEGAFTYGEGADLPREGEYYFQVRVEGGAPREARSGLLWCTDAV